MDDPGRLGPEVEDVGPLLKLAVGDGYALVLAQVL
jgi:hypothetical protein